MLHKVVKQCQCLRHILAQSAESHRNGSWTDGNIVVGSQFIKLLANLLGGQ
jgi:hypothetical protein